MTTALLRSAISRSISSLRGPVVRTVFLARTKYRLTQLSTQIKATTAPMSSAAAPPELSGRISRTDEPCIVQMQRMLRDAEGVVSLAQGVTHWAPPAEALSAAAAAATSPEASRYCADDGLPELRAALVRKLEEENGMTLSDVMVTAGANQAFTNVVLALCDAGDEVVLFAPYYFNHKMALQMTDTTCVLGQRRPDLQLDLDWLEANAAGKKMVVVVNPCNPTGVVTPRAALERARDICARHGTWLLVDNTYEHFVHGSVPHACVEGDHVLNVYSFSKAFGMMGWRIGYIAYPRARPAVCDALLKAQDTIVICPTVLSQRVAMGALGAGRSWVGDRVAGLDESRALVRKAVQTGLGEDALVGDADGAIYMMAKLPLQDDTKVVEWLAKTHGVCVIPGSSCGAPGHIRLAYANMETNAIAAACERLTQGLKVLREEGLPPLCTE